MHIKTPWYHGWNIVTICIVVQMAGLGVMANCFSFFLEHWSRDFDVPISTLVLAITLFSIPSALLAPCVGWAIERFSVRRVMLCGMLGIVLSYTLVGLATRGWHVIAIYALLFPLAILFTTGIPSQTLVSRWFVRRRGLAFSLSALGLVVAGILYPPLVVGLLAKVGWRETWWIFAGFNLIFVFTLMLLVLRDRPRTDEAGRYIFDEPENAASPIAGAISVRGILSRRNFWLALFVHIPLILVNSALSINFAPFVKERGLSLGEAATLLAIFNIAAAIGKLGAGAMADRYGNRLPLFILAVATATGTFILIFARGLPPMFGGFVLLGLGQGTWVLLASCMATEFGAKGFPRAYGLANLSSLVTTMAAPALAYAAEVTKSYVAGLVLMGIGCIISVLCAYFFTDRPQSRGVGNLEGGSRQ